MQRTRTHPLAPTVLLAVACALPAAAEPAVSSYAATHRSAAELATLAGDVLGEEVRVAADIATNTVLLAGESGAVARALSILRRHDVPLRSVLLHYRAVHRSALEAVRGEGPEGSLSVGLLDTNSASAFRAAATARREADFRGSVTVVEGRRARLLVGRGEVVRSLGLGFLLQPWWGTPRLLEAETGIEARPVVLPDGRVRVELRAFLGDLPEIDRTRFGETATSVVLRASELAVVGASGADDSVLRGRRYSARYRASPVESRVLLLSARVVGGPRPAAPR